MSDRRILALGLTSAFVLAAPAFAELPAFGMVRLSEGQTATLHLVLTHEPDKAHPGCHVTASFVDAHGQTLKNAAGKPYVEAFVLVDNVAAELSLPVDEILPAGEDRALVRAALRETPGAGEASDCCALTPVLEIGSENGSPSREMLPRGPNPPNPFCAATAGGSPMTSR
jgi:hypothetical protein